MKKILGIIWIVLATSLFADKIEFLFDWNNATEYKFKDGSRLEKKEDDFSYTIEGYGAVSKGAAIGWGATMSRISVLGYGSSDVILTPLYLTTKYYLNESDSGVSVFLKVHGGGYLNQGIFGKTDISNPGKVDIDNGWYYAAGGGFEFKNFILQAMYKQYTGDATIDGVGTKFDYYTTSISLGYGVDM